MDLITANGWMTRIIDQIDDNYRQAESNQHAINKIANLLQSGEQGEVSLCVSNYPATTRTAFASTLGLTLKCRPGRRVLVVLYADCLVDMGIRLLATQSDSHYDNYQSGDIPDETWPSVTQAIGFLHDKCIHVIQQAEPEPELAIDNINQITESYDTDIVMVYMENSMDSRPSAFYKLLAGLTNHKKQASTLTQLYFVDNELNLKKGTAHQHACFYRTVTPYVELWRKDSGELIYQILP